MGIIFDAILIAIIVLNIFICYKKGLVKLAVGLVAVVAAILVALIFYKPISNMIVQNTEIDENIEKTIIENFTTKTEENTNTENKGFDKYIEKYVDDAINKTQNQIVVEAANVISIKVIDICTIIGLFIIVRIVLILLTFIADAITSLPILKQFNEIGGIIYGVVKSLLIIYAILAVLFFIVYTTGNTTISDAISNSIITKVFYDNNLLLNILF